MLWDHYYYAYCTFSLFFINYTRSLSGVISYVFSAEWVNSWVVVVDVLYSSFYYFASFSFSFSSFHLFLFYTLCSRIAFFDLVHGVRVGFFLYVFLSGFFLSFLFLFLFIYILLSSLHLLPLPFFFCFFISLLCYYILSILSKLT